MNDFEKNIISIYQNKGDEWLINLPKIVQSIAVEWKLDGLSPLDNLSFNYVLSGFQKGKPIILKLGLDTHALAREASALKAFSKYGAAHVLNEKNGMLLLEWIEPGISLKNKEEITPGERLKICCDVMASLYQAPFSKSNFPDINDWLSPLDKKWNIPACYLEKAREIKSHLQHLNMPSVLLHGDLHHDNILLDKEKRWKVIDPKGVVGYPINEVWAFIHNIEKDAQYIAERFNWNTHLVLEWYFVHLILAICWNLEDNLDPKKFLGLAESAYKLI